MARTDPPSDKIPVVMLFETSPLSHSIFNPNEWNRESAALVASCGMQYSLLQYLAATLRQLPTNTESLCQSRFADLRVQWQSKPWTLTRCRYFVEVPEAHLQIQAFLVTTKTLLDLLSQLLTTEAIVDKKLDGFHKQRGDVGGELLTVIEKRVHSEKAAIGSGLLALVRKHKAIWIDQAVTYRDNLTHPRRGMSMLMYELEIAARRDVLSLVRIKQPTIDGQSFVDYADRVLPHIRDFCFAFLQILRNND